MSAKATRPKIAKANKALIAQLEAEGFIELPETAKPALREPLASKITADDPTTAQIIREGRR